MEYHQYLLDAGAQPGKRYLAASLAAVIVGGDSGWLAAQYKEAWHALDAVAVGAVAEVQDPSGIVWCCRRVDSMRWIVVGAY